MILQYSGDCHRMLSIFLSNHSKIANLEFIVSCQVLERVLIIFRDFIGSKSCRHAGYLICRCNREVSRTDNKGYRKKEQGKEKWNREQKCSQGKRRERFPLEVCELSCFSQEYCEWILFLFLFLLFSVFCGCSLPLPRLSSEAASFC